MTHPREIRPVASSSLPMNRWPRPSHSSSRHGIDAGLNSTPSMLSRLRILQETLKTVILLMTVVLLTVTIWAGLTAGLSLKSTARSMQILAKEAQQRNVVDSKEPVLGRPDP